MRNLLCFFTGFLLSILSVQSCQAWELLEVKRVDLTYINFFPGGRDPLVTANGLPDRQLGKAVGLNLDIDVAEFVYFNNWVHTATDEHIITHSGQFRSVGWQSELGVRITQQVEIFFQHHSQHVLDTFHQTMGFPVQDGIGFRLKLISKPRGSIF